MPKLKTQSLVDLAEQEISRLIDTNRFEPGERLSIAQIARDFGTSVVPVREAMARLHSQGILLFEPNKGYSVTPIPGADAVTEMLSARLAYEVGAIELAFEQITARDVARLREINNRIKSRDYSENVESYRIFVGLNAEFHRQFLLFTDNKYLIEAYDDIGFHKLIARTLQGRGVHDIAELAEQHDHIINAIERGDKRLCQVELAAHITYARDRIRETETAEVA